MSNKTLKSTKILLAIFGGATLALAFSACSQNAAVNNQAANANQANTGIVGSDSTKPGNNAAASDSKASSASVCDVTAYVTDKDPKGLNVRDASSENGKVIGQIPLNKDGTQVHIISSNSSGWVMVDKASTYKTVFDKKGWVSANLLAISTRGYDKGGVELFQAGKGSKVLTKIPEDMEVKIIGCDGKRMQVKYKDFTGWLEPDARCDSSVTRCN